MACRKYRSVGCGYPVFCTACLLWKQDAEALAAQYEHLRAAVDAVMDGQMKPTEKPPLRSAEVKPPVPSSQKLQSIKDFAASIGISVWTVRGWAYSGRIASITRAEVLHTLAPGKPGRASRSSGKKLISAHLRHYLV